MKRKFSIGVTKKLTSEWINKELEKLEYPITLKWKLRGRPGEYSVVCNNVMEAKLNVRDMAKNKRCEQFDLLIIT